MNIDLNQIRELLQIVSQTEVTELTIESGEEKVTIKKGGLPGGTGFQPASMDLSREASSPAGNLTAPQDPSSISSTNGLVPIFSPMVGTFYRSSSPNSPPFVNAGDSISVGQTVCIIEAMKLMNDLPSEVSGRIVKICVENGTTIEYGQSLFLVDPNN